MTRSRVLRHLPRVVAVPTGFQMRRPKALVLPEEYVVRYGYQDADGFWKEGETRVKSAGKCDHETVERLFLQEHPGWVVRRITYQ